MPTRTLLIVAHCPSENLRCLRDALIAGATRSKADIRCLFVAPLESGVDEVASADAIVLLTPENLGYMAGAMKDWFDRIYYPLLESKQGMPCVTIIRAGHDGTGTRRAIETITTGLRWRFIQEPITLQGQWHQSWTEEMEELGEGIAVALAEGII